MALDLQEQPSVINLPQETLPAVQYRNPIPVTVVLQPVFNIDPEDWQRKIGLLVVTRAIEPIGGVALPGGYLEWEDWHDGAVREYREEVQLNVPNPDSLKLFDVQSVQGGRRLIIFAEAPVIVDFDISAFEPNSEVSGVHVIFKPEELCFSSHTAVVRKFFEKEAGLRSLNA